MNTAGPDMLLFFFCTCLYTEFQLLGFRSEKVLRDSMKCQNPVSLKSVAVPDEEGEIDEKVLKEKVVNIILRHLELME